MKIRNGIAEWQVLSLSKWAGRRNGIVYKASSHHYLATFVSVNG